MRHAFQSLDVKLISVQALFKEAKSFYDVNIVNETRNDSYKRLAKIGASVGVNESELLRLLWINDKPAEDGALNTGNGVTNDLKVLVKMNRMQGVHVTPTVVFGMSRCLSQFKFYFIAALFCLIPNCFLKITYLKIY